MLEETLREWEERKLDEGRLEGRQQGRLEGRQQGRLEGRQQGRLEGRQEGRLEGRQEGRQEGLAAERALLCRQAGRRFGAATGDELAGVLAGIVDGAELARIGTLIIDCASGPDLLARVRPA